MLPHTYTEALWTQVLGLLLISFKEMKKIGKENENTFQMSQCPHGVRVVELRGTAELSVLLL